MVLMLMCDPSFLDRLGVITPSSTTLPRVIPIGGRSWRAKWGKRKERWTRRPACMTCKTEPAAPRLVFDHAHGPDPDVVGRSRGGQAEATGDARGFCGREIAAAADHAEADVASQAQARLRLDRQSIGPVVLAAPL